MAGTRHPLYSDVLGCFGPRVWKLNSVTAALRQKDTSNEATGMIGFDIACESARSGPRMQGYLVNAPCEPITAEKKQSDFALAA